MTLFVRTIAFALAKLTTGKADLTCNFSHPTSHIAWVAPA